MFSGGGVSFLKREPTLGRGRAYASRLRKATRPVFARTTDPGALHADVIEYTIVTPA